MAELAVRYKLDADRLLLKDLVTERDFLAERLGIPEHLLQVLSLGNGSIVITYWIVREVLPLAELALCREDVRAELTQHGVEVVYIDSQPSEHPGSVCSGNGPLLCSVILHGTLSPPIQVDQSLQIAHCKGDSYHVVSLVVSLVVFVCS